MSSLCVVVFCVSRICVVRSFLCDAVCLCMLWHVFVVCLSIALVCFVCAVMLVSCLCFGVYVLFVVWCVAGCCFIGLSCVYVLLLLFRFSVCFLLLV